MDTVLEIIPNVSTIFISFVTIGGLVVMAMIFALALPHIVLKIFEE